MLNSAEMEKENSSESIMTSTESKNLKRIRAGHAGHFTKLINESEEAMKDSRNIELVERLRLEIYAAYGKLEEVNTEYVKTLNNEADVQRELKFIEEKQLQGNTLEHAMDIWLNSARIKHMSPPLQERPASRLSSAPSTQSMRDAERKRRRAEMELKHLMRRQEVETKRRNELMRSQELYELACMEESFASEDNHLQNDEEIPDLEPWIPTTKELQMPVSCVSNNLEFSTSFSRPPQVPSGLLHEVNNESPEDDLRDATKRTGLRSTESYPSAGDVRSMNLRDYANAPKATTTSQVQVSNTGYTFPCTTDGISMKIINLCPLTDRIMEYLINHILGLHDK